MFSASQSPARARSIKSTVSAELLSIRVPLPINLRGLALSGPWGRSFSGCGADIEMILAPETACNHLQILRLHSSGRLCIACETVLDIVLIYRDPELPHGRSGGYGPAVPHAHGQVRASGGGQESAVGTERHTENAVGVSLQVGQLVTRGGVPDPDRLVKAGRGELRDWHGDTAAIEDESILGFKVS